MRRRDLLKALFVAPVAAKVAAESAFDPRNIEWTASGGTLKIAELPSHSHGITGNVGDGGPTGGAVAWSTPKPFPSKGATCIGYCHDTEQLVHLVYDGA